MVIALAKSPGLRSAVSGPAGVVLAALVALALLLGGCTSTDPYTGEQRIDAGSTALAIGALAAVGAVAYAASRSGDDDDEDDDWNRYYSPSRNVRCYRAQRACYDQYGYSAYWSRREFGRDR